MDKKTTLNPFRIGYWTVISASVGHDNAIEKASLKFECTHSQVNDLLPNRICDDYVEL